MLESFTRPTPTYATNARLTRGLIQEVAESCSVRKSSRLATEPSTISGEWAQITMYGSLSEALGEEVTPETPPEILHKYAADVNLPDELTGRSGLSRGKLVEQLWEHHVGDRLHVPTFVRDFPLETSPLTRQHRSQPGIAEKWGRYVRGIELATGYSQLVDPVVERHRLEEQAKLCVAGDEDAMRVDEDFLRALEYGMPPQRRRWNGDRSTSDGVDRARYP
jgi:lysyl-tRNA synthetase class 2